MHLDLEDYIKSLRHERFRSVIIYHKDFSVLEKFFIQSALMTGGYYLDLLNHFLHDPELTNSLDSFSVAKLKFLLAKLSKGNSVVFVSNVDFLIDTWGNVEKMDFAKLIEKQWNGFYPENSATLIVGLQADNWVQHLDIIDTNGRPRVHKLSEFKAIS
jgi:hypothetical protein